MLHLLVQLQQKLQLDHKTNITQICQKIELYGSPTTKGQMSRKSKHEEKCREAQRGGEVRRGTEKQSGQSHIYVWCIKICRDTSGVRDTSLRPAHPALGSSVRKLNPQNFWL